MRVRWIAAMLSMCLVLQPAFSQAAGNDVQSSPLYQSLAFNAAKGDTATVLATLDKSLKDKKDDFDTLNAASAWLMDNTYSQLDNSKIVASYFLRLYDADYDLAQLYKQQKGGQSSQYRQSTLDAFKALLTYELMAMADAQRCRDPSVIGVVAERLGPRYQDINYAYTFLNQNEINLAWYSAMQVEEQKSSRPFNLYLCLKGDKATSDPSNYNPVDVSPSEWTQIRGDIRSKYTDYWKSRYADAVRAGPAGANGK